MYKFNSNKYMTKGVQEEIPEILQIRLWSMIETMLKKHGTLDYLQIFNLSCEVKDGKRFQKIDHSQEVPKFKYAVLFETENVVAEKIYVIDDNSHITMLLASEY